MNWEWRSPSSEILFPSLSRQVRCPELWYSTSALLSARGEVPMRFRSDELVLALSLGCFLAASGQAAAQTLVASPSELTFRMQADSMTLPAPQTMQITSPRGTVPFYIVVSPNGIKP